jgi:flagellar basal body-associated protein FliL
MNIFRKRSARTWIFIVIVVTIFALSALTIESFWFQARAFQDEANQERTKTNVSTATRSQIPKAKKKRHEPTLQNLLVGDTSRTSSNTHTENETKNAAAVLVSSSSTATVRLLSRELEAHNLTFSARHQHKLNSKRHLLPQQFYKKKLFSTNVETFGAIPLNEEYAYM